MVLNRSLFILRFVSPFSPIETRLGFSAHTLQQNRFCHYFTRFSRKIPFSTKKNSYCSLFSCQIFGPTESTAGHPNRIGNAFWGLIQLLGVFSFLGQSRVRIPSLLTWAWCDAFWRILVRDAELTERERSTGDPWMKNTNKQLHPEKWPQSH